MSGVRKPSENTTDKNKKNKLFYKSSHSATRVYF